MSFAETAELAVNLKLGTTGSFRGATSEIQGLEAAAARGTLGTGILSRGFGAATGAASRFGGALGHAKSQIGGLITGPLGLAGLGLSLFSIGGALEGGIQKATEMGKAASRLSAITGLAVETTSALSSAMDHFGISADKQLRSVGFLEKNVGLLASRKDGIVNFEKDFSFSLTDANGNLKDANALVLQSADYFNNKSIPATTKAAALAKLYGRSWQDLIPLLSAGSAGIAAAEEEARKFGLTLTKDNIGQLAALREATRNWGTALGGLEVQIGLLVVGPLTDLAKFGTTFLAENRDKITAFFKNLIHSAQQFAGFVTGTVVPTLMSIGSAAKTAWEAVPAPIRDLLVKGFVADKAVKFLFGFSPITFAKDALGGLLSKGGTPFNPLFVKEVGLGRGLGALGGGLPGLGAAAAEGGAAAAGLGVGTILAGVAAGTAVSALGIMGLGWLINATSTPAQMAATQANIDAAARRRYGGPAYQNAPTGPSDSPLGRTSAAGDRGLDSAALRSVGTPIADKMLDSPLGRMGPQIVAALRDSRAAARVDAARLNAEFRGITGALTGAKGDTAIAKALKAAMTEIFVKGKGGSGGAQNVLAALKIDLVRTHDPQLQAALREAIGRVEHVIPARKLIEAQLTKADQIFRSNLTNAQKITALQHIEEVIGTKNRTATKEVAAKIDAAKRAQVAAQKATTAAVQKEKNLQVVINNLISVRGLTTLTSRDTRYYRNGIGL
jgi:hypothetical protein